MRHQAQLSTGVISVDVDHALVPAEDLFGFAERINPKRAFLFVSKVLGRHIPVAPSEMHQSFAMLAQQIDAELPGPVLFIGMAETAIGLGAGVQMEYSRLNNRSDAVYLCTTRHDLGSEKLCEFSEDHSHATQHLIHLPQDENTREMITRVRSLVLVDDEASTGNTFANLFAALPEEITGNVEKIKLVTLTDWSNGAAEQKLTGDVESISLIRGRYTWLRDESVQFPAVPQVESANTKPEFKPVPELDWGRLGVISHEATLPVPEPRNLSGHVLVLGTGEHVWQPYRLALDLEEAGNQVSYASITRSPISVGHVIGDKTSFFDNYGLGVANYCYNLDHKNYGTVILCVESPLSYVDPVLFARLKSICRNIILISSVDGTAKLENNEEIAA
jgi:hypothetical protein